MVSDTPLATAITQMKPANSITPGGSRGSSTWRWIAIAGWLALLVVLVLQWRSISQVRQENDALRAQIQAALPEAASPSVTSAAAEAMDMEQVQKDRRELLRLRNEVRQLREQASSPSAAAQPIASQPVTPSATAVPSAADEARQWAVAALGGDTGALDKLANLE